MASGKRAGKKGAGRTGAGVLQRIWIGSLIVLLSLCGASITYSFFLRHAGTEGVPGAIRVEVLNGVGVSGLASRASESLRRMGVDVLREGNAPSFSYEETLILAKRENPEIEVLARRIGCRTILQQLDENAIVDATLILGADYRRLNLGLDL